MRTATKIKAAWKVIHAGLDTRRPLLAQMVITKRCNLSCGYCFEYDKVSKPVPLQVLKSRVDELKRLRVVFVTLNGGEPLLHPEIVTLTKYIQENGMIPMINSNGWLLKPELINQLNKAGLFGIQISCDGLEDNEITRKSMRRLRPKLEMLKEHADFKVRINCVLGAGNPQDVVDVAKIVMSYDFDFQCSLVRDAEGSALLLDLETQKAYLEIRKLKGRLPKALHDSFQLPLVKGQSIDWKCRSGARYFHLDAEGMVHYCQPRTGAPNKRIEDYTVEDILESFYKEKSCSKRCPHAYAHIGSRMDKYRRQA
ncbi:MAG: radical SAM protein [Saprospiraceae bacterium]